MTSNMSLSELEDRLDEKVKEQNDNAYNLLIAINSRNAGRVKEQRNAIQAKQLRTRLIAIGSLAVGTMVAYFYYKAKLGMF